MLKVKIKLLLAAALMSILFFSCGTGDGGGDDLHCALDSIFGSMFADDEPGAVVLLAKGDSVIYSKGFGLADLSDNRPMSDSVLLNICSISKQFSAVALLKLQEEGLLSLDDSLPKYFPEFKAPFFNNITLRHLLSHTSGIPDARPRTREEWIKYDGQFHSRFSNVRDYMLYGLTGESITYMQGLDGLDFEPGTSYEYENPTYQLVLPIVEQISGQDFTEWMDMNIFKPAGMEKTVYIQPSKNQPGLGHAYTPVTGPNRYNYYRSGNDEWEECDYGEANFFPTKADGGLYTTAKEFLVWERALFGGKILNEKSLAEALTPYVLTDIPDTYYGLGLFLEDSDSGRKVYHTGDNGGFLTVECFFPEVDVFYLIFANRPDWNRDGTIAKMDSLLLEKGLLRSKN